jgi:hypothetical protein
LPPLFFDVLSRPEGRNQLTRLLQGDVYDRADIPILSEMRRTVQSISADSNHPWHAQLSSQVVSSG